MGVYDISYLIGGPYYEGNPTMWGFILGVPDYCKPPQWCPIQRGHPSCSCQALKFAQADLEEEPFGQMLGTCL